MTSVAWMTLIAVCGFVWGGFLLLLARAIRREAAKARGEG